MPTEKFNSASIKVRFSVRLKWLILLLGMILGFALTLYFVMRIPIEQSYRESFQKQFEIRLNEIRSEQIASQENLAQSVADMLQNPRLIAALEAGDMEQFYYDLSKLSETILRRKNESNSGPSPFVRFIDFNGVYQSPPIGVRNEFGIKSRIDESTLALRLAPMSQHDAPSIEIQSGFIEIEMHDEYALFAAKNIPLTNFYGEYWGDLIFVLPSEDGFTIKPNEQREIHGTLTQRNYYSSQISPTIETIVSNKIKNRSGDERLFKIELNRSQYFGYITQNENLRGFDLTAEVILFSTIDQEALLVAIQSTILYATVGFTILAILISLLATDRFTRPIRWLVEGTSAIRNENFGHLIPIKTSDELAVLSQSFNEMAGELEMKKRYRAVLDMVADPKVAAELTSGESVLLGGQDTEASILFCDIRGFTPWAQALEPADLITRLNEHMTAITAIVHQHGGVVDKFVGDEIMALFGVPHATPHHEQSAFDCALEILEKTKQRFSDGSEIKVGIGIASGKVVAGCMGSKDRLNYTVIGRKVNLASRLCGKAQPDHCILDEDTYTKIISPIDLHVLPLELKGFEGKIQGFSTSNE